MQLQLNGKYINLDEYYISLFPKVRAYIVQNSGNYADAKDIFQEALLATWLNVNNNRFKGNESDLKGYIYQMAKYKWLDVLKSKYKKSTQLTDNLFDFTEKKEQGYEEYKEVETKHLFKSIADLGKICRKILQMFYYQKVSLKDIGNELGYSESVTKTKKYRCMLKLRENYLNNYAEKQ